MAERPTTHAHAGPERLGDALERVVDASQRLFADRLDLFALDLRATVGDSLRSIVWLSLALVVGATGWSLASLALVLSLAAAWTLPRALVVVGLCELALAALVLFAAHRRSAEQPDE